MRTIVSSVAVGNRAPVEEEGCVVFLHVRGRDGGHDPGGHLRRKLGVTHRRLTGRMDMRSAESLSVVIALLLLLLSFVKGEIRCYCNQAACVSTGYMCKSSSFCYSDLGNGLHGCLERRHCEGLRCCREDMCNYMHVDIHVHTHRAPMTGAFGESTESDSERVALMESALRREVWFKAAVIAVPIGGVCVLVLLAAAAARMLRQDALRQRRLLELRRIYGHSLRDTLLPWNKEKDTTIV